MFYDTLHTEINPIALARNLRDEMVFTLGGSNINIWLSLSYSFRIKLITVLIGKFFVLRNKNYRITTLKAITLFSTFFSSGSISLFARVSLFT